MKSILLIDDCEEYRDITAHVLTEAGHDVWEASCPLEAIEIMRHEEFDLVVCDLHMPFSLDEKDQNVYVVGYEVGIKTIQQLKTLFPELPIIALSSTTTENLKRISKYLNTVPTYAKPIFNHKIVELVDFHLADPVASMMQ